MQFNCHIRLGKLLSREFNIRGAAKAAFLWGNVEPDIAFTSHFCRRTAEQLEGHNYPLASRKAARLMRKLPADGARSLKDFFRLGKICHYAADCFTWPHNPDYPGTLSAHISYEQKMSAAFHGYIPPDGLEAEKDLLVSEILDAAHIRYAAEDPSIARDLRFILAIGLKLAGAYAGSGEVALDEMLTLPDCKEPDETVREIDSELLPRLI